MRVYHPVGSEAPVIVRYKREVRPDVAAALQWMRARRPTIWARPAPPSEKDKNWAEELRKAAARVSDMDSPEIQAALRYHNRE